MANFLSYTFTQPYYRYIEEFEYNVIPATVTLTFDDVPSTSPNDYLMQAYQGILMYTVNVKFQQYDNTLSFSGNTAILTLPINIDSNAYVQFFYENSRLPFHILASEDVTYQTPAIFIGKAYALPS